MNSSRNLYHLFVAFHTLRSLFTTRDVASLDLKEKINSIISCSPKLLISLFLVKIPLKLDYTCEHLKKTHCRPDLPWKLFKIENNNKDINFTACNKAQSLNSLIYSSKCCNISLLSKFFEFTAY